MNWNSKPIDSHNQPELTELGKRLREMTARSDSEQWPADQLKLCGEAGVFRWFLPTSNGGYGWDAVAITHGYFELSKACLKTTFVITQRTAACKRIADCDNERLKQKLLPMLASGDAFATVGISHLTTSRRHLGKSVLRAESTDDGFVINGFTPWSTGALAADYLVMGAEFDDGKQILFVVQAGRKGLTVKREHQLVALTGSHTGEVSCADVFISASDVLSGPRENILSGEGKASAAGGLQTSTLALGLSQAAIDFIEEQSENRSDLASSLETLSKQLEDLKGKLLRAAAGETVDSKEKIRTDANSLVLRATQAALVAAKGAGFVKGHPVGRWCQEALFFLVWSCPQVVRDANLCQLAGLPR